MGIDILEFRSTAQGGFQKPNKYSLLLTVPYILQQLPDIAQGLKSQAQYLQYYADSVDFVGTGLTTIPITRYGYGTSEEHAMSANFQNVSISFYADAKGGNLFYFQQWLSCINNFNLQQGITSVDLYGVNAYENYYKDDYTIEGMITLLDTQGMSVATWNMREMFPKHIPPTKLAWNMNNDIMRCTVIFSIFDWYLNVSQGGTLINAMSSGGGSYGQENINQVISI